MLKNVFKFAGGAVAIAVLGIGALFAVDYLRYQNSPEYQAEMQAEQIKKEYAEDPYGGDTPEETLGLFVDALKKGDIDLAAKYFVLDRQDQWREDLEKIKDKGLLDAMVRDIEGLGGKYPLVEGKNDRFIFETYNKNKELVLQADMVLAQNKKWKIQDL